MRLFKDVKGNNIDPVNHTLSILKEYPYAKIHIGSDSQNVGKKTNYTSVIAYRLGTRGVHYILSKSSCCLLYTSPSPRDISGSRMPSSA